MENPLIAAETVRKASLSNLHTHEATGSSPVVSTRKFLISQEIRNFSLYFVSNNPIVFLRFSHDPDRDP